MSVVKIVLFVETKDLVIGEGKQENHLTKKILEQEKQINHFKSMKEKDDKERVDLNIKISKLETQINNEKDEQKTKVSELEKQLNDEKALKETAIKAKDDLLERNLKLEKENNDEKTMKNKYEKEKDDILDFLAREVTCSVCLMIPRTKKIPICRNGHTTCETCKR